MELREGARFALEISRDPKGGYKLEPLARVGERAKTRAGEVIRGSLIQIWKAVEIHAQTQLAKLGLEATKTTPVPDPRRRR